MKMGYFLFSIIRSVVVLVLLLGWCDFALGKLCTNEIPKEQSTHSFMYELQTSNNETWKNEMLSHYHLTPTDASTWANLLPRKILKEEDANGWLMMYRKVKNPGEYKPPGDFLKELPLENVRLDPDSVYGQAQQTNLEYLLMLDVDSLVWNFRKIAGLPSPGNAYGGWEAPNVELRGHFVGLFSFII